MGSADIIPGVSGGTIALIVGIYERLIAAIQTAALVVADVVRLRWRDAADRFRSVEWRLIVPLFAGILVAVLTLAQAIAFLLDNYAIETEAAFFGLVLASISVPWMRIDKPGAFHVAALVIFAAAAFFLLSFSEVQLTSVPIWAYFVGGAVAICAMILPGVSGAYLLEIMGLYRGVLDAVNDRDIGIVAAVGAGALIGLGLFSQVLNWALQKHHDATMAILTGLMLGSLRALWPWSDEGAGLSAPPADATTAVAIALAVAAAAFVILLIKIGRSRGQSDEIGADNGQS